MRNSVFALVGIGLILGAFGCSKSTSYNYPGSSDLMIEIRDMYSPVECNIDMFLIEENRYITFRILFPLASDYAVSIYKYWDNTLVWNTSGHSDPRMLHIEWNAIDNNGYPVPDGVYLLIFEADSFIIKKRVIFYRDL